MAPVAEVNARFDMPTNGLDVHGAVDDADVFDVDALIAEKDQRPFRWRFAGQVWEFPWALDFRVVELVDDRKILAAVEMLMGEEQYARLVAVPEILGVAELTGIIDRYLARQGLSVPNSGRPSRYSPSTRGR